MIVWNSSDWQISQDVTGLTRARRSTRSAASADATGGFPAQFLVGGVSQVEDTFLATPPAQRRGLPSNTLDFTVPHDADETYVVALRLPSGALTFHRGEHVGGTAIASRRGGGARSARGGTRFRIEVPARPARRGFIVPAIRAFVLKVAGAIVDRYLPKLVSSWEAARWRELRIAEGWHQVDGTSLLDGSIRRIASPASARADQRSLLLLHGTFSNAQAAFKGLAEAKFLDRVRPIYADRIYAYNHFTLSKTPEENGRDLLKALSDGGARTFDVVTHSRGGLVLRSLVELGETAELARERGFRLGNAVMVAAPNGGTPLATPAHWENALGWVANVVDCFAPASVLATAASWVAQGLTWIAGRATGGIPGLAAMDANGAFIDGLQGDDQPAPANFHALVANYSPDEKWTKRLLDLGADGFFAGANDLVVPSEGGWSLGRSPLSSMAGDRIGCFGPGGNLKTPNVEHLNILAKAESAEFIAGILEGKPVRVDPVDTGRRLPFGFSRRRATETGVAVLQDERTATIEVPAEHGAQKGIATVQERTKFTVSVPTSRENFELTLLAPEPPRRPPATSRNGKKGVKDDKAEAKSIMLLASYGGARVLEEFRTKNAPKESSQSSGAGGEEGTRFARIIAKYESLKSYVAGRGAPPSDHDLIDLGTDLFNVLFPPRIRRLYDVARTRERWLNVVFTSMVHWIADKPWEFAFDPDRRSFLAMQELHLIRNVITATPADQVVPQTRALRMLILAAQPVGTAQLSIEEETDLVKRGFRPLMDAGLLEVEVLARATPQTAHELLSAQSFDIVHFIGHGEFDKDRREGFLIFQDQDGAMQRLNRQQAQNLFCGRGIRLVFLNACETGVGDGSADFNSGVAQALAASGLPAVVANQFSVLDAAATTFSQYFYWCLARGMTFGQATREARIAVNHSIEGENIDWAVPVVYARDPDGRLASPREAAGMPSIVRHRKAGRRDATDQHIHVGVLDVTLAFPDLLETLEELNRVQGRFRFVLVDTSLPAGTWQHIGRSSQPLLNINRAIERLAHKARNLGLDYLAVITDRLLGYKEEDGTEYENFYAWWDEDSRLIFYGVAFKDRPTRGIHAKRLIANATALGLAGVLGDMGTDSRLPGNSLFNSNDRLSISHEIGHLIIDPKSRRTLRQKCPKELPAIEAILNAFWSEDEIEAESSGRDRRGARPARKKESRLQKRRPPSAQARRPSRIAEETAPSAPGTTDKPATKTTKRARVRPRTVAG